MVLGQPMRAVGAFKSRQDTEEALSQLSDSGFPMEKVSVIAKDTDRKDQLGSADVSDPVVDQAEEGAATGAITGTALGGLGGLLVGLGSVVIPGVGSLLAAGTIGTALATTAAGAGIGATGGSIVGAFAGIGIPEDRARSYSDRVSQGDYVVMVEGTQAEIAKAESLLSNRGIQEWGLYNPPKHQ